MGRQISNGAMTALAVLFLAEALTGVRLSWWMAVAAAVVLVINLPAMGKTFRLPAWIFFLLGTAVLLLGRAPLSQWVEGLNSMLKTAVILMVMQSLSLAMDQGSYEAAVTRCLRGGSGRMAVLYCLIMALSHLLASVMSLGSVVVILAAIGPALEGRLEQGSRFIGSAVCVGYCTLFLWAPGTVTVLMSMQVFSLSWQAYFLPAFLLATLGLVLGAAMALLRFRGRKLAAGDGGVADARPGDRWKLLHLVLVLAVIVVGITLLERLSFSTSTGRLLVVTLAVALVWLALQKGRASPRKMLAEWWNKRLPGNGDLSAFFLSMGFFSSAIQYSGADTMLERFCQTNQAMFAPLVLPLLPLVIVGLSLIGIHPFVSVLMVGPILTGISLPATSLQMGLSISLGCCLSYMLSPFAGLILTLSSGLKEPPIRVCRGNLGYAALYYLLAVGAIMLLL